MLGANVGDGSGLNPFGKLVDGYQQVRVSLCHSLEWSHEVEAPNHKRPGDGDHLWSVGREVGLLGIELAPVARADKFNGVGDGRWPVKVLSKGVAN